MRLIGFLVVLLVSRTLFAAPPVLRLDQCIELLRGIDERERSGGDVLIQVKMIQKRLAYPDMAKELRIYRREEGRNLLILFTQPKTDAGKGYLRLDRNIWQYDPATGKWERHTSRSLAGTSVHGGDLDSSRLAEQYDPVHEGTEKFQGVVVHKLRLTVKPGMEVNYPLMRVWVDTKTGLPVKTEEYSVNNRLVRVGLQGRWSRVRSATKNGDVWIPRESHFYDQLEKGTETHVFVEAVTTSALNENVFTKAWLESRSR